MKAVHTIYQLNILLFAYEIAVKQNYPQKNVQIWCLLTLSSILSSYLFNGKCKTGDNFKCLCLVCLGIRDEVPQETLLKPPRLFFTQNIVFRSTARRFRSKQQTHNITYTASRDLHCCAVLQAGTVVCIQRGYKLPVW